MWLSVLTVTFVLFYDVCAFEWDKNTKTKMEYRVCQGSDVEITIHYTLSPGELELGRIWAIEDETGASKVRYSSAGAEHPRDLMVTGKIQNQRLFRHDDITHHLSLASKTTRRASATATLVNPVEAHSGTYTLSVMLNDINTGRNYTRTRSVSVRIIIEEPSRVNGSLRAGPRVAVSKSPDAEGEQVTLVCGQMETRGKPPATASWTTPDGNQLPSTAYEDGYFLLKMKTTDTKPGRYTCNLTRPKKCLPKQEQPQLTASIDFEPFVHTTCLDPRIIKSGVYRLKAGDYGSVLAYCDLSAPPGGWTVFQRRFNGSVSFARNWTEYKNGFGDPAGEYWLGLEPLYQMTSKGEYVLRIDVETFDGRKLWNLFIDFRIYPGSSDYALIIGNRGCGQGLPSNDKAKAHNGFPFSTVDVDNDGLANTSCALTKGGGGGWWYLDKHYCFLFNLNGKYYPSGDAEVNDGLTYFPVIYERRGQMSLKATRMMFRKKELVKVCDFRSVREPKHRLAHALGDD